MSDAEALKKLDLLKPKTESKDRVNLFFRGVMLGPKSFRGAWAANTIPDVDCVEHTCWDPKSVNYVKPDVGVGETPPLMRAVFEIKVTPQVVNPHGTMHGGYQTTIFDVLSSFIYMSLDRFWDDYDEKVKPTKALWTIFDKASTGFGVSRNLSATYIKAIPLGEKATLVIELLQESKTFVVYSGKMYNSQGQLCTILSHDKVKTVYKSKA